MDPYRAPPREESPPRDAMRPVLFIAGAIAATIVIAAGVVSFLERGPTPSAAFPSHVYEFETSEGLCFGTCIPHKTRIDAAGTVKNELENAGKMYGDQTATCPPAPMFRATAADVAKLAELARAVPVETMASSYPSIITDQSKLTTTIIKDHHRFAVTHPGELPRLGGDAMRRFAGVAELIALHQEIERIANTNSWLEECRVSPQPPPTTDNINSLFDTR